MTHFEKIFDPESLKSLLKETKDACIFLDIDDTLITPVSQTFRSHPHNQLIDDIKKQKPSFTQSHYEAMISNWRLQRRIMLLNSSWPTIIHDLKKEHCVYGLTQMDVGSFGCIPSMEKWRYHELQELGIEFSSVNVSIDKSDTDEVLLIDGSAYYRGIFMTGQSSKSHTLKKFMSFIHASTFVLVDDRVKHLEDMQQFCDDNHISFKGVQYGGLEKLPHKPNHDVANFQKNYLLTHAQWLEDDVALEKMKAFI